MTVPDAFGVAAFGLNDICIGNGYVSEATDFGLSSVIFPKTWRGSIIGGDAAAESRLETGIHWPPEGDVSASTVLRHVPVSLLWSKLVQDGDKASYWSPGTGNARFATASGLYVHIRDILARAHWNEQDVAIAIPDALDEMGQEDLLRSFGDRREMVKLIWRPVAAAIRWLASLSPDFSIRPGDWMLVVYLGPDLFEATPFAIQRDEETGCLVPVRSRGAKPCGLTGMDWAWSCCKGRSTGEIWQQLMRFPEVWKSLTRQDPTIGSQRIISLHDGSWDTWFPNRDLLPWKSVKARGCDWLSAQIGRKNKGEFTSWDIFFHKLIQGAANRAKRNDGLRGIVLCGQLIPRWPSWHGLPGNIKRLRISRTPAPDSIWLPAQEQCDIIAEGARLYAERLRANLPTYLDTLPGLQIMIEDKRKHLVWRDLVASATCKGGQEYANVMHGFSYQKMHSALKVYLQKESEETRANYRKEEVPLPFVPVNNIPIDIRVRMKPASGLAQITLIALDNSVEDLHFDFSRMKEALQSELPKEQLFCPDDGHFQLAHAADQETRNLFKYYYGKLLSAYQDKHNLECYYGSIRTRCLLPSKNLGFIKDKNGNEQPLKMIDENGKSLPEFAEEFQRISILLEAYRNKPNVEFPRLAWLASFLWGGIPLSFRKEIFNNISEMLSGMPTKKLDKYLVEAAGCCFQTKEECRILFNYIVKYDLNYSYALLAAFRVLHYRPEAWMALEENTAYGLLKIALAMMDAQKEDKKVKFRNAASLIFVLLKYRLQPGRMKFLDKNDKLTRFLRVGETLQNYVDELDTVLNSLLNYNLSARTRKTLATSRKYIHDILQYINYQGNPSAVPVIDEE